MIIEDDKAAKALWASQLMALAEDYRKGNQFLDAGRLYGLVGAEVIEQVWKERTAANVSKSPEFGKKQLAGAT